MNTRGTPSVGHKAGKSVAANATVWSCFHFNRSSAARAVAPGMAERGSGYLVNTVSAAGILIQIDSVAYTVSKHAAIGLAEFLAAKYGPKGVKVSVLCPQGVRSAMTAGRDHGAAMMDGMLEPEDVARDDVMDLAKIKDRTAWEKDRRMSLVANGQLVGNDGYMTQNAISTLGNGATS